MNLAAWIRSRRPTQVYYGWWVLVVTSAMMFFANGIFFRGFTVLFVPVRDDLRLTNFQASLVFSVARAEGGIEGPAVGWVIDRIGVRKPVVAGVLLGAVGYFAFSQVDSFLWFTLVFLGVVSLGSSVAFQHTMLATLNMWFIRRRALVFSLRAAAAALGGVALIPLVNIIIIRAGWQWSAIMSGFVYLLLILPLTVFLRPSPESMGLLPDGDLPREGQPASATGRDRQPEVSSPTTDRHEYSVPEALHTSAYWLLLLTVGLRFIAVAGILVNLQPMLIWKGASQETVGYLLSFMLGVTVVARIVMGWAADKWSMTLVITICYALASVGVFFLLAGSWEGSPWAILIYLALSGVGDSASILCWAAVGDFFGRRRYATLRGIMTFSHSWALVGSPIFVGWWADHTDGDYALPLWIAAVVLGLAALCGAMIRRPRHRVSG